MDLMKRAPMSGQPMPLPASEPTDGGTGGGDELMQMLMKMGLGGLGGAMGGGGAGGILPGILQQLLMSKLGPGAKGGMSKRAPVMTGDAIGGGGALG